MWKRVVVPVGSGSSMASTNGLRVSRHQAGIPSRAAVSSVRTSRTSPDRSPRMASAIRGVRAAQAIPGASRTRAGRPVNRRAPWDGWVDRVSIALQGRDRAFAGQACSSRTTLVKQSFDLENTRASGIV